MMLTGETSDGWLDAVKILAPYAVGGIGALFGLLSWWLKLRAGHKASKELAEMQHKHEREMAELEASLQQKGKRGDAQTKAEQIKSEQHRYRVQKAHQQALDICRALLCLTPDHEFIAPGVYSGVLPGAYPGLLSSELEEWLTTYRGGLATDLSVSLQSALAEFLDAARNFTPVRGMEIGPIVTVYADSEDEKKAVTEVARKIIEEAKASDISLTWQ